MYSIPNPFSANIRHSHEESERFKEQGNTVEYEEKLKRLKEEVELFGLYEG